MARPNDSKVGLDYFSHDTDILQDPKIRLLKAKHGLLGYAVYLRLLEELYREKGYYLQINEDVDILFCDDNNIEYDVYISILSECITKGLFNSKLYEKYNILTSNRIQLNYIAGTKRRKSVSFYEEYLLVDVKDKYNDDDTDVYIVPLNDDISRQSKEKEKEKEILNDLCESVIIRLNEVVGSNFKTTAETHRKLIIARYHEGYGYEEFERVIMNKYNSWMDTEYSHYLKPATLFCKKHFDNYLNEPQNGRIPE